MAIALSRFAAATKSPVSLPTEQRTRGKRGDRRTRVPGAVWQIVAGIQALPIVDREHDGAGDDGESGTPEFTSDTLSSDDTPIEERIDLARAAAKVRAILDQQSEAARAVLLDEEKSAEVAKRMGLPYRRVTDLTAAARLALRAAFCGEVG